MNKSTRCVPVRGEDPAGLDKLLLALGKACHDYGKRYLSAFGVSVDFWDGENGLKSVLQEVIEEQGVPNRRFGEIVNPRTIAQKAGVIKTRPQKRRIAR